MACMLMLAVVLPAGAVAKNPGGTAYLPDSLYDRAAANPGQLFQVIVEATSGTGDVRAMAEKHEGKVKRNFRSIPGASVEIRGSQLLKLAQEGNIASITSDSAVRSQAYENNEIWREAIKADTLWGSLLSPAPQAPAIAVVDSGVDTSALDFGTRIVAAVAVCSMCATTSAGDEQGHGTMVAALAAGSGLGHEGVAPNAPIVSVRVSNANGESRVSDVIAAADWIIANKAQYNIRVANFSLGRAEVTNPLHDPLNHAVERLWFNDVVVVASAGNHGSDLGPVKIKSPGNDPFVITVGAVDTRSTANVADDVVPAWSAYGTSVTGFSKPDLGAPGRYMVAAVPALGTLPLAKPERVLSPGYMWMSGTSFASAVVSGAAAQLLARHPDWTPDEVKGALMLKANVLAGQAWKAGVGEIDAAGSAALVSPPSANANLYSFVTGAAGARSFDGAAWSTHVTTNPLWTSSAWIESAWSESAWSESAWSESAWSESAWSESAWSESAWSESAWVE